MAEPGSHRQMAGPGRADEIDLPGSRLPFRDEECDRWPVPPLGRIRLDELGRARQPMARTSRCVCSSRRAP